MRCRQAFRRLLLPILFTVLLCSLFLSACAQWQQIPSASTAEITPAIEATPAAAAAASPAASPDSQTGSVFTALYPDLIPFVENIDSAFTTLPQSTLESVTQGLIDLQPTIKFQIPDNNPNHIDTVMLRAAHLVGLTDIAYDSTYYDNQTNLDVQMSPKYSEAFRVRMSFLNPNLADQLSSSERELYQKAVAVLDELSLGDKDDAEKARAIHDYLLEHVAYPANGTYDDSDSVLHEARGALIDGKAVCDGYTEAYQLLLAMEDIDSVAVSGVSQGEAHAWNLVRLSGKWYHADVTWDDPRNQSERQSLASYGYFLINDDWIGADHEWERTAYPKAEDNSLNPYSISGRVVTSYPQFVNVLTAAIMGGEKDISVYVISYRRNDYPLSFLDYMLKSFYYQEPDEGMNGVFRIYFD